MNYLAAINKTRVVGKKQVCVNIPVHHSVIENDTIDIESSYLENMKDSHIIYWSQDIIDFWTNFIEDTLLFDIPLLIKHHTGYKNFLVEIVNFIQSNLETEIKYHENESEREDENFDDLNLLDEMYMKNNNYSQI